MVPVIIQYFSDPGQLRVERVRKLGGQVKGKLSFIKALSANLSPDQLQTLAADPAVSYISIDRPLTSRQAVTITALDYTAEPINAPAVWAQGFVGTNIGIAVIDSGIQPVPDLNTASATNLPAGQPPALKFANVPGEVAPGASGRIVYSENFVVGQNDARDSYGHGTHVAGLIAGNGAQSSKNGNFYTFYGVAPNANLINLRALDANGAGTDSSVIAAN
jgi:serine protease AprX